MIHSTYYKKKLTYLIIISLLLIPTICKAQSNTPSRLMFEQASELTGKVVQYSQDMKAIKGFYSPFIINEHSEDQTKLDVLNSPEQREKLIGSCYNYLRQLEEFDFASLSIYGKVDYILLKKKIKYDLYDLEKEDGDYLKIAKYLKFSDKIYSLESKRRRGDFLDGKQVAEEMVLIQKALKIDSAAYSKIISIDLPLAQLAQKALTGLIGRLKDFFCFYNTYDPEFTWWVPQPYQALNRSLTNYSNYALTKGRLVSAQRPDSSGIKGVPIGRTELIRQLQAEMIPYTPEELIQLATKEFAWCDAEMLKASREMGFGDDWKKALEKVKNSYVPVGHQPELIIKLYNDALNFIKQRDLITIPSLAEQSWGMVMMSPERQLINPFFTGGKEISVSYPANTMEASDKLMSMRGNNPYFSRATVQHELIPGHNYNIL